MPHRAGVLRSMDFNTEVHTSLDLNLRVWWRRISATAVGPAGEIARMQHLRL